MMVRISEEAARTALANLAAGTAPMRMSLHTEDPAPSTRVGSMTWTTWHPPAPRGRGLFGSRRPTARAGHVAGRRPGRWTRVGVTVQGWDWPEPAPWPEHLPKPLGPAQNGIMEWADGSVLDLEQGGAYFATPGLENEVRARLAADRGQW